MRPVLKWSPGSFSVQNRHIRILVTSVPIILSILSALTYGFLVDESWFLAVLKRITAGEVLYRDVFFNTTPLAIYLAIPFVKLFGVEVLTLRGLLVFYYLATYVVSCRLAHQLGIGYGSKVILVIALVAYAPPGSMAGSHYNIVSILFFLICFSALIAWVQAEGSSYKNGSRNVLILAGCSAGLCFTAKYNIGVYAFVALLAALLMHLRGDIIRRRGLQVMALVTGAFILPVIGMLLLIGFSGGIEKFIEYTVQNKALYMQKASIPYLSELKDWMNFGYNPSMHTILRHFGIGLVLIIPIVAFLALGVKRLYIRSNLTPIETILLIFMGISLLNPWPRYDVGHLVLLLPPMLLGLLYAWKHIQSYVRVAVLRGLQIGLIVWIGLWCRFHLTDIRIAFFSDHYRLSALPHHTGIILHKSWHDIMLDHARDLKQHAEGDTALIISPYAGFFSLITGLKNPTPYDYTLSNSMGPKGQMTVIKAISQRRIHTIYVNKMPETDPLRPVQLEEYIQSHMIREKDIGGFTLYRGIDSE